MLSKTALSGLLLLSLMGCGKLSTLPPAPERERVPVHMTEPVPEPLPDGKDNSALARLLGAHRSALELANTRLLHIREWSDDPR